MTVQQFEALPAAEKALQLAEESLEATVCRDCGHPIDECSDPKKKWFPQMRVDYAAMEKMAAQHAWEELHSNGDSGKPWHDGTFKRWSAKRSDAFPYFRDWGVEIFVTQTDLEPDADWLKPASEAVPATSLLGSTTDDESEVPGGDTP